MYLDKLRNNEIFIKNQVVKLEHLTGIPSRKGLENAILSEGQIVNVVSQKYTHLPNEAFFLEIERALIEADLNYIKQSINRNNRSFAVDYILQDGDYEVNIKNEKDNILPMMRFTNGYDGSTAPSGRFGFFRKVCANGLHVAETKIGFKMKHIGDIQNLVLHEVNGMIRKFMKNEYFEVKRKFDVLAETPIDDIEMFTQVICKDTNIFKYAKSENNNEPSKLSQMVIDIMQNETLALGIDKPNLWLGYNAFNEVLHNETKKTFESQRQFDNKIFTSILSLS